MKRLLLIFLPAIALSCNNGGSTSKEVTKDSTANRNLSTAMDYPYKIDHPDNWDIGGSSNTMVSLKSLKAWEEGKMDESIKYFADSIRVFFDGPEKKMTNDSLKVMLKSGRDIYKTIKINMQDWESVISKDRSEEWVTLWYTENWETQKGEKDSLSVVNDLKLKDGKITRLYEYSRKLH